MQATKTRCACKRSWIDALPLLFPLILLVLFVWRLRLFFKEIRLEYHFTQLVRPYLNQLFQTKFETGTFVVVALLMGE